MEDFESIVDMFIRFMVIINKLQALRKIYKKKKREKDMKIMRFLPNKCEIKVITIQETKDLTKLTFKELIGSLTTDEINIIITKKLKKRRRMSLYSKLQQLIMRSRKIKMKPLYHYIKVHKVC